MVVETIFHVFHDDVYDTDHGYFETVDTASDIAAAFKSGKNVVVHLPCDETAEYYAANYGLHSDMYIRLCGVQDGYVDSVEDETYGMGFYFYYSDYSGMSPADGYANDLHNFGYISVIDNKIRIKVGDSSSEVK